MLFTSMQLDALVTMKEEAQRQGPRDRLLDAELGGLHAERVHLIQNRQETVSAEHTQ